MYEGDLVAASFRTVAQDLMTSMLATAERNQNFIAKRTNNFDVPEGFQALWQTGIIMDKHVLRESCRRFCPADLFFDHINSRNAPELPTAFLSNNMVLTARYVQSRYEGHREFEAAMIEFEDAGYNITCISKNAVQIGLRDGQAVIAGQQADYKICGVIEAETDIPGITHIVGLKVELAEIPGNPIFFFKAFRVPEQVSNLMSKSGDQVWDRRAMTWKSCDVTRAQTGVENGFRASIPTASIQ